MPSMAALTEPGRSCLRHGVATCKKWSKCNYDCLLNCYRAAQGGRGHRAGAAGHRQLQPAAARVSSVPLLVADQHPITCVAADWICRVQVLTFIASPTLM